METEQMIVTLNISDLRKIINDEVTEVVSNYVQPPKEELPEKMRIDEAVRFLNENGYKASKSFIQKICSQGKIPYFKVCGKAIFERKELLQFIDNQSVRKGC